nr:SCO-spondin-like [Vulpes vulpes]
MKDDFETRSNYVASSELEFVNSWKDSPLCGDTSLALDPCSLNTFRRAWAERKCGIINSPTFASCHSQVSTTSGCTACNGSQHSPGHRAGTEGPFPQVYHLPYYEACVQDACGCDTTGDCECLCDAVAAYAKACLDKGVCVDWRTPDFCRECPTPATELPGGSALPGGCGTCSGPLTVHQGPDRHHLFQPSTVTTTTPTRMRMGCTSTTRMPTAHGTTSRASARSTHRVSQTPTPKVLADSWQQAGPRRVGIWG